MDKIDVYESVPPFVFDFSDTISKDCSRDEAFLESIQQQKNVRYKNKIENIKDHVFFDRDDVIFNIKVKGTCKFRFSIDPWAEEFDCQGEMIIPHFTDKNPIYQYMLCFSHVRIEASDFVTVEYEAMMLCTPIHQSIAQNDLMYTRYNDKHYIMRGTFAMCDDIKPWLLYKQVQPTSCCPPVRVKSIRATEKGVYFFELVVAEWESYHGYYIHGKDVLIKKTKETDDILWIKMDFNNALGSFWTSSPPESQAVEIPFTSDAVFYKTTFSNDDTAFVMHSETGPEFIARYDGERGAIEITHGGFRHSTAYLTDLDIFRKRWHDKLEVLKVQSNNLHLLKVCPFIYSEKYYIAVCPPITYIHYPRYARYAVRVFLWVMGIRIY